ncbi:universal stress protein [Motiliproteus sp. MSK22-1]|uniref:universal stress protein n=1 Tax=Motiliproteus sp. MSK22-1 TaxID=1897630 RepID=UPI000975D5A1|nr:universal stress protein [Motiliproteus sp. MSK22-1]OMH31702.1 universal stress family protein [Motiliproteus sp. MSK22-1]
MLPDIETILYCTDLSKNASYAFKYAAYLAKKTGAKVHILHVVEKLSNDARITLQSYVMSSKSRDEFLNHRIDHAKELLQKRQDYFWDVLAPTEKAVREQIASIEVVESYPAETILKRANELNCGLIVMGAHEKGLMHTFLGSVAKSVLRRSRIPTVIVPLPEKDETKKK